MKRLVLSALALACVASPAWAQPAEPYSYYNKPGATLADQRADIDACMPSIMSLSQPYNGANTAMSGAMYGAAGLLIGAAADAQAQRMATQRAMQPNYDSCMSVRGWRVVQVDDALGQELGRLDPAELELRLAPLIGEATPAGRVSMFSNQYAQGEAAGISSGYFDYLAVGPRETRSLSMRLMPESYMDLPGRRARGPMGAMTSEQTRAQAEERRQLQARQRSQSAALFGRSRESAEALTVAQVGALAPDATVVIVRVWGGPAQSTVVLVRADAAEGDEQQDSILAAVPQRRRAGQTYETLVFAVPPGHWRVTGMTASGRLTSFCMGAPGFDVAAGEAVFAGSFAFGVAGERRPDLSVERTYTELSAAPALMQRLRPAAYRNGETFECGAGASFVHALEVRDAPFVEGYSWGSLAQISASGAVATPAEEAPAAQPLN